MAGAKNLRYVCVGAKRTPGRPPFFLSQYLFKPSPPFPSPSTVFILFYSGCCFKATNTPHVQHPGCCCCCIRTQLDSLSLSVPLPLPFLFIYIYLYPGHPSSSFHPIRSPIVHTFLYSSSFILCIYFHIALWLLVPLDASSERPRRYYPKNWIERGEIKTFNDKYICSPFLPCRSFYLSGCRQKKKNK